jgi:serine/threonine-protein kinase
MNVPERLAAALADRYTIERELGAGGMATVYLADDLKHDRKVAVKVLKPELAAVIGGERFVAEIKTTAGLQHPHILPLFDSGESDGFLWYVMPYIEGETLRDRLDREKQLGVDEAVRITKDVADALDYAHRNDVIHRDIKPENILLHDGRPVVADFGIAVAISAAGGGRMTETGLSLGTPHYMSPEQATADRDLTARSDVYSLACVLYEMLSGDPPHTGPTAQAILVRILTERPRPVSDTRTSVPPHIVSVLAKGLEKLPADRFETAAEFRGALDRTDFAYTPVARATGETSAAGAGTSTPAGRGGTQSPIGRLAPWGIAAAAVVAAVAIGLTGNDGGAQTTPTTRAAIDLGEVELESTMNRQVISPDGRRIALVGGVGGSEPAIWLRDIDEADFRKVPGTEDAISMSFSPDGESLVFGADGGGVRRVAVAGGATTSLSAEGAYPNWGADGWVYIGTVGLVRVPASGGEPDTLLAGCCILESQVLPGEGGIVYSNTTSGNILYFEFGSDSAVTLVEGATSPRFVPSGHLLWVDHAQALWAAPFDPEEGTLSGRAGLLLDGVTMLGPIKARYSVSDNGTLVYGVGGSSRFDQSRELVTVTLDGTVEAEAVPPGGFSRPRWSPNGQYVAFQSTLEELGQRIFVYDFEQKSQPRQLSSDLPASFPVWAPSGDKLAFTARSGEAYVQGLETGAERELLFSSERALLTDWPDPNQLMLTSGLEFGESDLYLGDASSRVDPQVFFQGPGRQSDARVAPQGDLVAYTSTESGQSEVYVKTFPRPGGPERVSDSEGGAQNPIWSPDGNTIYYESAGSLYAARIQRDPSFAVVDQAELFALEGGLQQLDLHPDGQRFIGIRTAGSGGLDTPEPERHFIVTNWFEELRAKVEEANVGR